ncbi:MAG: hypothetical protein ACP5LP_00900 [Candidatus Micrarchaeia archaeon]
MKNIAIILMVFTLLGVVANAQKANLGEVAGPLNFNVPLGGNETLNFTILYQGGSEGSFQIIPPTLTVTPSTANVITPQVIISPMNGSFSGMENIKITVNMPSDVEELNHSWTGIIQAVQPINKSSNFSGGAIIAVGVAKTISIKAYKPTVVTSPVITYIEKHLVLLGGVAIAIVIILIIVLLLLHRYLSKKITRGA